MADRMMRCLAPLLACICLLGAAEVCEAQQRRIEPGKTIVEVEVLTPRVGGSILAPQQWGQAFDKLGQSIRIRSPLEGDKPMVAEQIRGTLRFVKVTAALDVDGRLMAGDRVFTLNDMDKIKAWLDELKTYGAQGSPEGQPLWGLTREQFTAIFAALSTPVETFNPGGKLLEQLAQIPVPADLPLKFHQELDQGLVDDVPAAGQVRVAGLTAGTALAVLLSQRGLGFRPLRTPEGAIELVVQKLDDISDPWPIGWDIPAGKSPGETLPQLFVVEPLVGLDPQPLEAAMVLISEKISTPLVLDYRRCEVIKIDARTLPVKSIYKRTAWGIVLKSVLSQNRLTYTLRNDERGQVFVYVHPFEKTTVITR